MDDYVARIDQHPVALRRAYDTRFAEACFLQFPDEIVGNGADMPLGATRCHDHLVAD
jgi:hypothetical protein